jgi:DmsE family decaheme c-type cytochrome
MHRDAIKPHRKLTAFILTGLIYSCFSVGATQPAAAEAPPFNIEQVRAAVLGSAEADKSGAVGMPAASIPVGAELPKTHPAVEDEAYSALLAFAQQVSGEQPQSARADDDAFSILSQFAQQVGPGQVPVRLAKVAKAPVAVKAEPAEATYVGQQVCLGCHAVQAASFGMTLMGRIFRNPRNVQERGGCETCHGPGSLHVKAGGGRGVGGIISFRADDTSRSPAENNAICLSCHERGDRTYWSGSTHETRGLACTNCHQVMQRVSPKFALFKGTELETCFQCHKDRRAQLFRSSHMPLREGKMTCSDCHNPHGSATEALLREASINDTCYKCHAEKRGPFLFEHAPVRENCDSCHEPHGSVNEFLLKVSRPRLCTECHNFGHGNQGPLSQINMGRACQNCHTQVHGTNSPSGALLHR